VTTPGQGRQLRCRFSRSKAVEIHSISARPAGLDALLHGERKDAEIVGEEPDREVEAAAKAVRAYTR